MSTEIREERFTATDEDVEVVSKSRSGLIVTPDAIERARARVAAGESIESVAFDLATEDVAARALVDNPGFEPWPAPEPKAPEPSVSLREVVYGDVGGQRRPVAITEAGMRKTIIYTEVAGELRPTSIVVERDEEKK